EVLPGPFMVMRWVPGVTLLRDLLRHPLRLWWRAHLLAEMQARLNTLPITGVPAPPGELLSPSLEPLPQLTAEHDMPEMLPGLCWLEDHRPRPPERPSILHLDYHPLNFLIERGRCTAVLDWCEADVGDYHADVAVTRMLMDLAPVPIASLWMAVAKF